MSKKSIIKLSTHSYLSYKYLCTSIKPDLKTFKDIPGPLSLPVVGTAWKYFPIVGEFDHMKLQHVALTLNKRYGPVVKENVGPFKIVHLYDPKDFEIIYKLCGQRSDHIRLSFFLLKKYRENKPGIYKTCGLLPNNGSGWWEVRKVIQKPISRIKEAQSHLSKDDDIIKEFVHKIGSDGIVNDYTLLANRLNMETTLMFLFGERFHCFSEKGLQPSSMQSKILEDVLHFTDTIGYFDRALFYWTRPTSCDYKKIYECMESTEKFALEQIEKVKNNIHKVDKCLISQYIMDKEFDKNELGSVIDLLYAGIDTAALTTSYLLYAVGRDDRVQKLVKEEAVRLLPQGNQSHITADTLNQATYIKAVIKETLRLYPIITAQNRKLPDTVRLSSGYELSRDTLAVFETYTACRSENNFKDATKFKPERWIKSSSEYEESNPYIMLSFGLGIRTCIGRRRAEQLIQTLLLRIFSQYEIKTNDQDLGGLTPFLLKPERPLKVLFNKFK